MTHKSDNISELSRLVRDPALQVLDITLSNPNLFDILGVSSHEIRHSNFLAWLLTPNESHHLGDIFLKWFLREVFSDGRLDWINEFKVDAIDTKHILLHREFSNIDILIEGDDFVIVIENKFGSKEHSDQLSRYKNFVEKDFPDKKTAYIFLTPTGDVPEKLDDRRVYISISYEVIVRILEQIIDVHGNALTNKIKEVLDDYVSTIRRQVMCDDEAIRIAREIYKNHRKTLDFIFEHKPDHFTEVLPFIEEAVKAKGYCLLAKNKLFCRFTTSALLEKLEPSQTKGWSDNSPMAFQLNFRRNNISFEIVVAPNEEMKREALKAIIGKITKKKSASKSWSTMYGKTYRKYDLEKMHDKDEIWKAIDSILTEHQELLTEVEQSILKSLEE